MEDWMADRRLFIHCTSCDTQIFQSELEAEHLLDIEESVMGEDIVIFVCPECGEKKRSYVRST